MAFPKEMFLFVKILTKQVPCYILLLLNNFTLNSWFAIRSRYKKAVFSKKNRGVESFQNKKQRYIKQEAEKIKTIFTSDI